ncbi:MAG: hypothetical protein Q7Q71_12515 [Verrucomicrobiota bacterium JB023]|nr:hypothetical protein [Verrucomicrobiota bacterium JB023]
MKTLITFLFATSLIFNLQAQEEKPREMRILPLGDNPPFRQEVRDGARYELAPEPGTVPPPTLLVPAVGEGATGKIRLRLNTPSQTIKLPSGDEPGKLPLKHEDGKPWVEVPFTGQSKTLTLIWRGGRLWNEVRSLTLPDGDQAVPANACRFVNTTSAPIGLVWGSDKKRLKPGEVVVLEFPSKETPLEVLYPTRGGDLRPCLKTIVEQNDLIMQQFLIYRADGEDVRMPVKVYPFRENR